MRNIKSFYVSVLSQAFSPCQGFLAAGTNFGNINIFNVDSLYETNDNEEPSGTEMATFRQFSASSKPVQAMVSSNRHLIVGSQNSVQGYEWDQLVLSKENSKDIKPNWSVDLNLPKDFGTKETVDSILPMENTLFVACGDNNIYQLDMECGKSKLAFSGHSDFIHSMSLCENQLSTASEDGTVHIWDTRKPKPVHTITPYLDSKLCRPQLGKWVGAVAMSEDWLVCGGGPHLALYHLRSLTMSKVLLQEDPHAINNVIFHEDSMIVGVNGPMVYHLLFSGDVTVQMPTTPLRVYSLQKNENKKLLTVGGASSSIDICIGYTLQDRTVQCPS